MSRRTSRRNELLVGGLVLLAGLIFTWMSIQVGALKALGDTIEVTATFEDAAGLVEDAAVKVAGVKVGGVKDLSVDFDKAVVTLVLDAKAGLRNDVRAQVRARSLLGEKFIALTPQTKTAPLLGDGDSIKTIGTVDIDQLVTAIGPLLAEVRPEDMAKLVEAAGSILGTVDIDELVTAIGPLLAEVRPEDMAKLVEAAGSILGTVEAEAPELVDEAKTLLGRLNEMASIAPSIKTEVPAALADVRTAARRLDATITKVDGLLDSMEGIVQEAEGAMGQVTPAVKDVRALLDEIGPGIDDLRSAMEQSDEAMASIRKVLKNVEGLDEEAVVRILREEGVLVRLKAPPPPRKN